MSLSLCRYRYARSLLLLASGVWLGALTGCNTFVTECVDNQQYFQRQVWGQVASRVCIKCHSPDGIAAQQNSQFLLLPPSYPGFIEANYNNMSDIARYQYGGMPVILLKPLGQLNHGGGKVIEENSREHRILADWVERVARPVTCKDGSEPDPFEGNVTVLSPVDTLRKAALDLVGRLPTEAELARVRSGGEPELRAVLEDMMKEEAFYSRVGEIWNDVLLTNRYLSGALNLLNESDYPGRYWYNPERLDNSQLTPEQRLQQRYSEIGIASEPLELIKHVVRENRPFSEILTADYTVVNPYSARVYSLDPATLGFVDVTSPYEFREARVSVSRNGQLLAVPHAGVLTQTVFLRRYPTTTTNLNRHRARTIYRLFLATDILRLAERPIDPSSVSSLNPTRDDVNCNVCHRVIDPIASNFQRWDQDGRFRPELTWPVSLPQPGLGQEVLGSVDQYPQALSWLAGRIVADNRFATAVVQTIYRGLLGRDPLGYPVSDAADFDQQLTAWQRQQALLQAVGEEFRKSNYNLRKVFVSLILSPDYRASSSNALQPAQLEGLGAGRLLPPELLSRKIAATTGLRWTRSDQTEWLLADYNLIYGGIDSNSVTERLTVPNGVMANVAWRMASEMACRVTAWEFTRPQGERLLLSMVEVTDRPFDQNNQPVPEAMENIKRNLQYLHQRLLGEELAMDDPELERSYQLFLGSYQDAVATQSTSLPFDCQGRVDRLTGAQLPTERMITADRNYTIRPWMAVVSYLLADWRFLYGN
jgi:hypothetical protein